MAWTSPMVFVPGAVLTAAQMNTHLRDNLLELAPAKTSQAGSIVMGAGYNKVDERIPYLARVNTTQSTKKNEYVDLSTAGPSVKVKTGTKAMVFISASSGNTAAGVSSSMSYDITGSTFRAASDDRALICEGLAAAKDNRWCHIVLEEDLKPGVNTFTCKYKCGNDANVSTWHDRFICVWPI